jgi:hypothetical protein
MSDQLYRLFVERELARHSSYPVRPEQSLFRIRHQSTLLVNVSRVSNLSDYLTRTFSGSTDFTSTRSAKPGDKVTLGVKTDDPS